MKRGQIYQLIESYKTRALILIDPFTRSAKKKTLFLFLVFLFFFLPGENFYERLRLEFNKPLVRGTEFNLPELSDYPINITGAKPLYLTAKSAIVVDVPSKVVIFAKNPNSHLSFASTTKMMTALIVLENYKLDDVLVASSINNAIERNMGLEKDEKMTVENLLYGLLVQSANDAALTLALSFPGGMEKFIFLMNQRASELSLLGTHFVNVSGIDQPDHYSTVYDLAHLAAYAIKNPIFAKMVNIPRITVSDIDKKHYHELETTNELIGKVLGLKGVKTGWTEAAGECLVSYVERNERKIVTVILGSNDRFGETKKLIDWVFENFEWQVVNLSTQD